MKNINSNIVYPPNKQMEVNFEFSKTPNINDYFLFLDFNSIGSWITGSADLSGTFWEGNILYFQNEDNLIDLSYSKYYVHTTSTDAKFVNDDTVAVAEDTGLLNILAVDDSATLKQINHFRHSQRISELGVWKNSSNVVTAFGRNIAVWDINSNEKRPSCLFENIHTASVNSVDTVKSAPGILVSGSSDRKLCLWDLRADNPPTVLYSNEFSSLTKVVSNPKDSNYYAVGTQGGDIYIVDKREPGDFVCSYHCFNKPVKCLAFDESHKLAVSGEINKIIIFDTENNVLKDFYTNEKHENHVKALRWYHNYLYSCGFGNRQVLKHNIKDRVS